MPKPVSGKQKKQMLREEREKKMLRKQNEESEVPLSSAPKLDP